MFFQEIRNINHRNYFKGLLKYIPVEIIICFEIILSYDAGSSREVCNILYLAVPVGCIFVILYYIYLSKVRDVLTIIFAVASFITWVITLPSVYNPSKLYNCIIPSYPYFYCIVLLCFVNLLVPFIDHYKIKRDQNMTSN